jgi:hypothetical protein
MLFRWLLLLPLFLLTADFQVNWISGRKNAVRVRYQADRSDFVRSCVRNELKVRYRYDMQLCRRRSWWLDSCQDTRRFVNTMEYDPITESYVVFQDGMFDEIDGTVRRFNSFDEAIGALSAVSEVKLADLTAVDPVFLQSPRLVMAVRLVADCRGDYNRLFADISSFITFGFVRISGFDTGVIGFDLET